jgi:L-ribulokinase
LECAIEQKLSGPLHAAGEAVGTLCAPMASALGLPEGIAVATALPDGHGAALGLGICSSGDMMAVLGTSGCFMTVNGAQKDVPGICGTVKDGIMPGLWGYEAGLCCLGDHYAFAAERLTSPEYVREAEERGIGMLELLLEKAAAKRVGESGVLALNWFNGNRSTLVNGKLSGLFVGLTLSTAPEDIMRALVEANAFGARNIIENFEQNGIEIKRIFATGGIAHKSPFVMQTLCDVLGRELVVPRSAEAPALSAAIAASAAAGVHASLSAAVSAMKSPVRFYYTPNPEHVALYTKLYAEYKTLHDYFGTGTNAVMERLRDLAEQQRGE